ncbi:hypothetical protein QR98_0042310 [Sarcoptes scabiei]|uniref:Kinesin-associated microtubule-binding domain-containing protein n=1 Tax=Sarcoptes scabiei TaxID=52283 RepID=A0A132A464_SARSC|nr:hypothetical protein QR98_0042310 [Sarcoptes scabiei]
MIDNLDYSLQKYQSSGCTPQRCHYEIPRTFTPTSPYPRILERNRSRMQKQLCYENEILNDESCIDASQNQCVEQNGSEQSDSLSSTLSSTTSFLTSLNTMNENCNENTENNYRLDQTKIIRAKLRDHSSFPEMRFTQKQVLKPKNNLNN